MSSLAVPVDPPPVLAICVPARNEAKRLPRLFDALDRLLVPAGTQVMICLFLDSCSDGSAGVTADYAAHSRHPVHIATHDGGSANAGMSRHAAMSLGMAVLGPAGGILLTTDADSWPRADWLGATVNGLASADLVAGNVLRSDGPQDQAQDRIESYYAHLHLLRRRVDPVAWEAEAMHHHASGANMAMRAEVYAALGGFPPLISGEDAQLADDAARAGFRVRRDAASVVHTSARRQGRARGGLATALHLLDRIGLDGVRVTHPVDQLWQYRQHALARRAFGTAEWSPLAAAIGLSTDHLRGVARDCPNGEAFAMRAVPEAPGGMRQIPFEVAEAALAMLTAAPPAQAA